MKSRPRFKPIGFSSLCVAMCLGTLAYAQDAAGGAQNTAGAAATNASNAANKATANGQDEYPDLVEIDPFGGVSTWGQVMRGLTTKLANGGLGGLRLTFNPSAHLGLELWAEYDTANVVFRQSKWFLSRNHNTAPGLWFRGAKLHLWFEPDHQPQTARIEGSTVFDGGRGRNPVLPNQLCREQSDERDRSGALRHGRA